MKRRDLAHDTGKMNRSPKRRRLIRIAALLLILYLIVTWIGQSFMVTRPYTVAHERIASDVRIALITDLHASLWGAGQEKLLRAIGEAEPDFVLICGDLVNMNGSFKNAETLVSALAAKYPCYYVAGNHEYQTGRARAVFDMVKSSGATMLSGQSALLKDTTVRLAGLDDIHAGVRRQRQQLAALASEMDDETYTILAVHRPNEIETYIDAGFDLVLSGHTHGGQVRIPGLLNGLYAPEQGLFPRYGGGRYDFGEQTLIISRGLSKRPLLIPRVFNQPELVIVTLTHAD